MSVRNEINELSILGPFPSEIKPDIALVDEYERLLRLVIPPVSDQEASVLVKLFGEDGYFGLADSCMHLIETAPGWPLMPCLGDRTNYWINELYMRCVRAGVIKD